jgi:hypothetical protein
MTEFKLEPTLPYEFGKREADYWPTPRWCVEALLREHPPRPGLLVIEPAAGEGHIVEPLRNSHYRVDACEIRGECKEALEKVGARTVLVDDWLSIASGVLREMPKVSIVANPPFSLCLEFAKSCVGLVPYVAMLLPLSFLASKARAEFNNAHPVSQLLVLGKRPSFSGDGKTDSTDCAWFIWDSNEVFGATKVVMP